MQSKITSVAEYLDSIPEDKKQGVTELRKVVVTNLPSGFTEVMASGMLGYVVPHTIYPAGYHCDPNQPLPFMNIAAQKNFIALYHMGIYADAELLEWFTKEYPKHSKTRLDMGKSCIRFKNSATIPFELIGLLASKFTVQRWLETYESVLKK